MAQISCLPESPQTLNLYIISTSMKPRFLTKMLLRLLDVRRPADDVVVYADFVGTWNEEVEWSFMLQESDTREDRGRAHP